jgi:hypothetical protein
MRSHMFKAQLTTLWYRFMDLLADLYPNIPVDTREYLRLTDFRPTLYTRNRQDMKFEF